MPLDRAAVAHIATLARIKVPEGELVRMAKELDGILHWVEQLKEDGFAQAAVYDRPACTTTAAVRSGALRTTAASSWAG
ncbi:MAG: aspartyl/glutamyl-tRNA amidotransferase subunit C [Rhodospirillales bacterium]|nr:aspartyl/glutamyl-tRNA amidotransferase subunit C [Rhodospirillales bacterium]